MRLIPGRPAAVDDFEAVGTQVGRDVRGGLYRKPEDPSGHDESGSPGNHGVGSLILFLEGRHGVRPLAVCSATRCTMSISFSGMELTPAGIPTGSPKSDH